MTVTRADVADHVIAQSAPILDRFMPGWHNRVDLDNFDMGVSRWCIAGQAFSDTGYFTDGMIVLMDTMDEEGFEYPKPGWYRSASFLALRYGLESLSYLKPHEFPIAGLEGVEEALDGEDDIMLSYSELRAAWVKAITQRLESDPS